MFGFGKKNELPPRERYGEATLAAIKAMDWEKTKQVLFDLEREKLAEASVALGQLFSGEDTEEAVRHFKIGADLGNAEAAWGVASNLGHGYIPDIAGRDGTWYRYCLKAAQGGCADAMNELGNIYNRQDVYLASFYWFQLAGYYEHPTGAQDAQNVVEKWKNHGCPNLEDNIDGVREKDVAGAKAAISVWSGKRKIDQELVRTSMVQGMEGDCEFLQLFIGDTCEFAFHDDATAKMQYQLAAHNESPCGMRRLGNMLAYGKGCEQNLESAFTWFPAAADAGEKIAQFVMGQVTKQQNPNLAAYWFMSSYRRGYEPAWDCLEELAK